MGKDSICIKFCEILSHSMRYGIYDKALYPKLSKYMKNNLRQNTCIRLFGEASINLLYSYWHHLKVVKPNNMLHGFEEKAHSKES